MDSLGEKCATGIHWAYHFAYLCKLCLLFNQLHASPFSLIRHLSPSICLYGNPTFWIISPLFETVHKLHKLFLYAYFSIISILPGELIRSTRKKIKRQSNRIKLWSAISKTVNRNSGHSIFRSQNDEKFLVVVHFRELNMRRSNRIASIQPKKKKHGSLSAELSTTHILDLNDDCLRDVFKMLDLSSLCALANVCTRFRCIAQDTFKVSKFKRLELQKICCSSLNRKKQIQVMACMLRHFGAFIEALDCSSLDNLTMSYGYRIIELMSRYCNRTLTELEFNFINVQPHESQGRYNLRQGRSIGNDSVHLISQLSHLKILSVGSIWGLSLNDIPKICQSLNELTELHLKERTCEMTPTLLLNIIRSAENLEVFQYGSINPHFYYARTELEINDGTFKKLVHIVGDRRPKKPLVIYFCRCICDVRITHELAEKHKDLVTIVTLNLTVQSDSEESFSDEWNSRNQNKLPETNNIFTSPYILVSIGKQ